MSIIELGICGHPDAEEVLLKWDSDKLSPGQVRGWLESNVWPRYGSGLWSEPWSIFMREFARAVQPYAHYSPRLAQWQAKLHGLDHSECDEKMMRHAMIELKPRAYDPQKATRITLFHAIISYTLRRIWMAPNSSALTFSALNNRLGRALGRSKYLDGHQTEWGQQFWAMMWKRNGTTILE
jgi:hypothetical protein